MTTRPMTDREIRKTAGNVRQIAKLNSRLSHSRKDARASYFKRQRSIRSSLESLTDLLTEHVAALPRDDAGRPMPNWAHVGDMGGIDEQLKELVESLARADV